jgi:hypothetical protein
MVSIIAKIPAGPVDMKTIANALKELLVVGSLPFSNLFNSIYEAIIIDKTSNISKIVQGIIHSIKLPSVGLTGNGAGRDS